MLNDEQLERYARQILITGFDVQGQESLQAATVLIVGLGGLGSPAALYLAAAGVGRLIFADGDRVELSNLQRQIAHQEADIGRNKASSAAASAAALNSDIKVEVVEKNLTETDLAPLLDGVDLVVDASDNYPIRFALNRVCIHKAVPLVSAAAVRSEGQISVFDPVRGGPCYRCLYQDEGAQSALSCAQSGVLAPVVGVFGSLLAMETMKVLASYGEHLSGSVLILDLKTMESRKLKVPRWKDCPDCGHLHK
jgi:molybdopterin/thiamine biosynthesis adenylyltransferase